MLALSNYQQSNKRALNCTNNNKEKLSGNIARILLVEDSLPIQQTMQLILEQYSDYCVDIASSGEEAIALLCDQHRVIIMDIGLLGMDGIETTKQIRQNHPNLQTTIIAHTAHGDQAIREQCLAAGMDYFLPKGVNPKVFMQLIERVLFSEAEHGIH